MRVIREERREKKEYVKKIRKKEKKYDDGVSLNRKQKKESRREFKRGQI